MATTTSDDAVTVADVPALAQQLAAAITATASSRRPLARGGAARARLVYDVLAVVCGARAAAMLDYIHSAAPAALAAALAPPVRRAAPRFRGAVLHLEGCCYVVDLHSLCRAGRARLNAQASSSFSSSSFPLLVTLDGAGALVCASRGGEAEAGLRRQLGEVSNALDALLSSSPSPSDDDTWPALDLGPVRGAPAMPTLNGWLLGYPVLYLVRGGGGGGDNGEEEAGAMGAALSRGGLRLFSLRLACECAPTVGDGGAETTVLLSFSLPPSVLSSLRPGDAARLDAALKGLVDGVAARLAARCGGGGGGVWGVPTLGAKEVDGVAVLL